MLSLDLKVGGNNGKVAGQAKILSSKHIRALTLPRGESTRGGGGAGGLPRGKSCNLTEQMVASPSFWTVIL